MLSAACVYIENRVGNTLHHLVELAEMCRVHSLVAENPVDRKVSLRGETALLVRYTVQHLLGGQRTTREGRENDTEAGE